MPQPFSFRNRLNIILKRSDGMFRNRWRTVPKLLAVSLIAAQIAAVPLTAAADSPVVSLRNPSAAVPTPVLKPAWSAAVDSANKWEDATEQQAAAANGKVFAFSGKKLIAIDATTGKKLWQFGEQLIPKVVYDKGVLYGITKNGALYAATEKGGKKWSEKASLADADKLMLIGDTLYITRGTDLFAYNAETGKLRWKANEKQADGGDPNVIEANGVVLRVYMVQGALTSSQLTAYDKKTGKQLWAHFRQGAPLAIQDGLVYSITDEFSFNNGDSPDRQIKITSYNLKSGVVKGERVYKWTVPQSPDGSFRSGGIDGSAFLNGNDLYIYQGPVIAKYAFNSYSASAAPKPVKTWNKSYQSDQYMPLYKIHRDRMLFQSFNNGQMLAGMKLANGQTVGWYGDNPAAQIDVYGNGVYIGQTDGVFHGVNFDTQKQVFQVKTGSRAYGPTLVTGGQVIIQAEGKLIGVKLPTALQ
ncbi:serine/threonine protein kinase [Paenibacillaceae bacterium]|nr:serine/threonine protein kinase [Paenibacillaceae bacterium]